MCVGWLWIQKYCGLPLPGMNVCMYPENEHTCNRESVRHCGPSGARSIENWTY